MGRILLRNHIALDKTNVLKSNRAVREPLVAAALTMPAPLYAEDRIITDKELSDELKMADWLADGRTHSEQRFSPLKDINVDNVGKLKPEWYLDLPEKPHGGYAAGC